MPPLTFVDATDLTFWATRREAQGRLPQLLRRLVMATSDGTTRVAFSAGDGVQLGGWDGLVVCNEEHPFIPRGVSVWEMGTNRDIKGKADDDYEKRSKVQPPSAAGVITPVNTTFVFVTPRRWGSKDDWSKERRAEHVWADVQAYDADDLESWLELAPATHAWLSELLGKHQAGVDDLATVWADWSEGTEPALSTAFMFAGRDQSRRELSDWIVGTDARSTISVSAESVAEVLALVGAIVHELPEDQRERVLSSALVVRSSEALEALILSAQPLIIVATFTPGDLGTRAVRHQHRLLVAVAHSESADGALKFGRVSRGAAEKALKEMGVPPSSSADLSGVARRGMLSFRRRLAKRSLVQQPAWASTEAGSELVPFLLLGQLNENFEGDRAALETMTQKSGEASRVHVRWSLEPDPPVRRVGAVWFLVSKEDAWERLSRCVDGHHVETFAVLATATLTETDPRFNLPADERWTAGMLGHHRTHSQFLVQGIADTLALLGSRGTSVHFSGIVAASVANRVVFDVLTRANADWRIWASLSKVLPRLAEASPDAFLNAVESGITSGTAPVLSMFTGVDEGLFSSSPHPGLLWALETVSWTGDFLGRAARILATLDRLAVRSNSGNQPANSLRSIFSPAIPQTSVGLSGRLAVIDMLREHEPESAWRLMTALLPQPRGFSMRSASPAWRDWVAEGAGDPRTYGEIFQHAAELTKRMLVDAGRDGERWAVLVEALDEVSEQSHQEIVAALASLAASELTNEGRDSIWNALRKLLNKHRTFPDASWALTEQYLGPIGRVFALFAPVDPIGQYAWLFANRPALPEGRSRDFAADATALSSRQREAASKLWETLGADGVMNLATRVERPEHLGTALGASGVITVRATEDALLRAALGAPEPSVQLFGRWFAGAIAESSTADFLSRVVSYRDEWPVGVLASALLALPTTTETLDVVASLGEDGERAYWCEIIPYRFDAAQVNTALTKFLTFARPHAAIEIASLHIGGETQVDLELVEQALLAAAGAPQDGDGRRADGYNFERLLDSLEAATASGEFTTDRVARLEFAYLFAFGHFGRPPRVLHGELARDPALFVEVMGYAYGARGAENPEPTDEEEVRARLSERLLFDWRDVPGRTGDGDIDKEALHVWISTARQGLAEGGRTDVGDVVIGQMLSASPTGRDGFWPHEAVRDLIEAVRSDVLERGMKTGRYNSRGVVTKDPLAGGESERSLADHYESQASNVALRWPRTAAMLRTLRDSYRRDGTREDVDAELAHDLGI